MIDYYSLSDEELVPLFTDNDIKAEDELTIRYIARAKLIALSFKSKGFEIADLVQEGMRGFLLAVFSFKPENGSKFSSYADVCIRNSMISFMRRNSSQKRIPSELIVPLEDGEKAEDSFTPEEMLISKQNSEYIAYIISTELTELERKVFKLFLFGFSYDEIAEKLDVTPKSVDGTLQRARKKLRSKLS